MPERQYYAFLDIARIIACFLVIQLHVSATLFYQFAPFWLIIVIYDSLARMSVPLFFMISGFLLLDSDISSLRKFYCKRYARILIPFGLVCALYYFTPQYGGYTPFQYLWHILNFFVDYHLWYIYVLTGIYFSLPFFIKIIHGDNGVKLAWLYVTVWLVASVLFTTFMRYCRLDRQFFATTAYLFPNGGMEWMAFDHYPNIFLNFDFRFFYGFMGYLICGWLIKKYHQCFGKKTFWTAICAWIIANTLVIYCTWSHSLAIGKPNELFFENLTPFVFLQAISFFILCTYLNCKSSWLKKLADCAFWIYLLHLFWLRMICAIFPLPDSPRLLWAIPLMSITVFGFSFLSAVPMRKLEQWLLALPGKLKS